MNTIATLFESPIAHRGLHDRARGIVENTPSAIRAAMDAGYGIEVDVQLTRDGEALVFHDDTLERLTFGSGLVSAMTTEELRTLAMRDTGDTLWSLVELLDTVQGKTPLIIEVKSNWTGKQDQLIRRVAEVLQDYQGPVLVKSFDPRVLIQLRRINPAILRGIIGCAFEAKPDWSFLDSGMRFSARNLFHWPMTRPHALSWDIHDLPRLSVALARRFMHVPVMSWTVRTASDQARAKLYANQIVFEGFRP